MPADLCPACGVSLPRDLMPTHLARAHPDRRGPLREERGIAPPPTEAYEGDVTAQRPLEVAPEAPAPTEDGMSASSEPPSPLAEGLTGPQVLEEVSVHPPEEVVELPPSPGPDPGAVPVPGSSTDPGDEEKPSDGNVRLAPDVPVPSRKALRTAFQRRRQQTNRSLAQAEALLVGFPSGGSRRAQRRSP